MQRLSLILLFILYGATSAIGSNHLFQGANQMVRLSEEMVFHGSEGHLHEIADYGEKMIIEIDKIAPALKNKKELQKSIKTMRDKTESAIKLGKQGNPASLTSAKAALFHAKKLRQALR